MFKNYLLIFKDLFLKYKLIISSVIYALLVGVVIYGMANGVYDGFPQIIPYIIIAIFLYTAFIRLYKWVIEGKPSDDDEKKSSDEKK